MKLRTIAVLLAALTLTIIMTGCAQEQKSAFDKPVIETWTETVDEKQVKFMTIDGIIVHETDPAKQPLPPIVTPGTNSCGDKAGTAPSDAVVLFDGTAEAMENWTNTKGEKTKWIYVDGAMECVKKSGYIQSKEKFGSCQLHIEWATPANIKGSGQGRGNSGVFLMGKYEVQVLNSYINETDPDRQAGAIYKQHIPLVNASRKPGKWQVYDIIFKAPGFDESGKQLMPGIITLFHNGVLVQNHVEIKGPTRAHNEMLDITDTELPLMLQDHKSKVSYRNIWIRKL